MKIAGPVQGIQVELTAPEPFYFKGNWWVPISFRTPHYADYCYVEDGGSHCILFGCVGTRYKECWVMKPIPRPTPEQLKKIGMKERDGKPVLIKFNEMYWSELCQSFLYWCSSEPKMYGFVLERVEKVAKHYSCKCCFIKSFND